MATNRTFSSMINEYLPNELLEEEFRNQVYLFTKVEKDDSWLGGDIIVPFVGAQASSVSFGSLTDEGEIIEEEAVRGKISGYKEIWGSMVFNHTDLMFNNKLNVQNFLKILPDRITSFLEYMRMVVSINLLSGTNFAKFMSDGAADGSIVVDRPDRFRLGQKVIIDDANSSPVDAWVYSININTKTIVVYDKKPSDGTRAALDVSAYTVAQSAKIYHPGAQSNSFSSLRSMLLSAANGGDTNLLGYAKTAYPFLQCYNFSGSAMTAMNMLEKILDAMVETRIYGKGNPTEVWMSLKNYATCAKIIEKQKGMYNVVPGSSKASQYGWMEIEVGTTKGMVKLVGIQEMDDDIMPIVDWSGLIFRSNGTFQKRKNPDGLEYYEIRSTSGFKYIIDISLFGVLELNKPYKWGIIHSIPTI